MRFAALLGALVACSTPTPPCSTNLQTDSRNCGACGVACAAGSRCEAGACVTTCPGLVCGGACVDAQHDAKNCGGCGVTCSANRAEGVCLDGVCRLGRCADGFSDCDLAEANGCEVNRARCAVDLCPALPSGERTFCSLMGISANGERALLRTYQRWTSDDTDNAWDLYFAEPAAGRLRRLTRPGPRTVDPGELASATLTADGKTALFIHSGALTADDVPGPDLFRIDIDSNRLTRVPRLPEVEQMSFNDVWLGASANGQVVVRGIAFDAAFQRGCVVLDLAAGARFLPSDFCTVSGDGTVAGYSVRTEAYVLDVDAGTSRAALPRTVVDGGNDGFSNAPSLSFDATRLAFWSNKPGFLPIGFPMFVDRVYVATRSGPLLGVDGGSVVFGGSQPTLSADGRLLGYSTATSYQVIDVDTGEPLRLDAAPFANSGVFAGDGRHVVLLDPENSHAHLVSVYRRDGGAP